MDDVRETSKALERWRTRSDGRACVLCGLRGSGEPGVCLPWLAGVRAAGTRVVHVRVTQADGTLLERDIVTAVASALGVEQAGEETTRRARNRLYNFLANWNAEDEPPLLVVIDGAGASVGEAEGVVAKAFSEVGAGARVLVTVTGDREDARRWGERLGGAEVIEHEAPRDPESESIVDALWSTMDEAARAPWSLLACAFAPVPRRELAAIAGLDEAAWVEVCAHPVAARVLQPRADDAFAFASEWVRRAWMARAGSSTTWDARFVDAARFDGDYVRAYAAAHAIRAGMSLGVLGALAAPARLLPIAPDRVARSFGELSRIVDAAERGVQADARDPSNGWIALVRGRIGIGALYGMRNHSAASREAIRGALRPTLRALAGAARDPRPIEAMAVDAELGEDPPSRPPDPAETSGEKSRRLLAAFDRGESISDYVSLVAELDLDALRRVIDVDWPSCAEPALTRLAALGQGEEALSLASSVSPGVYRCRYLLRVVLGAQSPVRHVAAQAARTAFDGVEPSERWRVVVDVLEGILAVFGAEQALAIADALGDALTQHSRIVALSRLARLASSPYAEQATALAMQAYRLEGDNDALDDVLHCVGWMKDEDAAWLLSSDLGTAAPYDGVVSVLVGHGGIEPMARLVARVGGDGLLLVMGREAIGGVAWGMGEAGSSTGP